MDIQDGQVNKIFGERFKDYLEDIFEAQNLSKIKYHTVLAKGSTMASVKATAKETSATNIKTVIAIAK